MGRWGSVLLLLALCAALLAPAAQGAERFSDVPAGSWYADTVSAMADRGWLSGYPDGTFQPGRTISAAEFVSVAVQCAGLTPKGDAGPRAVSKRRWRPAGMIGTRFPPPGKSTISPSPGSWR